MSINMELPAACTGHGRLEVGLANALEPFRWAPVEAAPLITVLKGPKKADASGLLGQLRV